MGFKDLHLKLAKRFGLGRFLGREGGSGGNDEKGKRFSWMTPVSHGYYAVEGRSPAAEGDDEVVVQREQVEDNEWWFYGVLHARIGAGVTEYLQDNLFNHNLNQSQMRRKSKETMKKAHLRARAKIMETAKGSCKVGSASAIVINGERLVIAKMGDYKAVICKDGEAFQIGTRHWQKRQHWSNKLFPGAIRFPRMQTTNASDTSNADGSKDFKSLELAVACERIDGNTEFVILASTGVWEVMKEQEAVNLIRHFENPQAAAECLAKEALTRMSKSKIACLIIWFD